MAINCADVSEWLKKFQVVGLDYGKYPIGPDKRRLGRKLLDKIGIYISRVQGGSKGTI
jgi:hypothetical protein